MSSACPSCGLTWIDALDVCPGCGLAVAAPSSETCVDHAGVPAHGRCSSCKHPVCSACFVSDLVLCRDCVAKERKRLDAQARRAAIAMNFALLVQAAAAPALAWREGDEALAILLLVCGALEFPLRFDQVAELFIVFRFLLPCGVIMLASVVSLGRNPLFAAPVLVGLAAFVAWRKYLGFERRARRLQHDA